MRLKFILFFLFAIATTVSAQYDIVGCGQGKNGAYLVKVTTVLGNVKTAKEVLLRDAVHGVLFRGFADASNSGIRQKPLVADATAETTKADFFNAFWSERRYEQFAKMTVSSFRSVKMNKSYEVSAIFLVDKEALLHCLEEAGVQKGFSHLW